MGRFTAVQGFSDTNQNNRTITYDQAKGESGSDTTKKLKVEKVINPYGSTSGAGSGEFHVYRHARARETARWKAIDEKVRIEKEEADYKQALEEENRVLENKTSKNRKKRQREKEAKRRKKYLKAAGIIAGSNEDKGRSGTLKTVNKSPTAGDEEEEFTYIPISQQKKEEIIKVRDDGGHAITATNDDIPNDGSFLEVMKRKLQEDQRDETKEGEMTTKTKDNASP